MELRELIEPLPETNEVKRLILFCLDDLKMPPYSVALTINRAYRFASGVAAISDEARREENNQRAIERIEQDFSRLEALANSISEIGRKSNS